MNAPEKSEEKIEVDAQKDLYKRCFPLNTDSPHAAHLLGTDERARFFLIDMSGLTSDAIKALLPTVTAEMARRRVVPVFITDLLDYRVFREANVIFEALPPVFESAALLPDMAWRARRNDIFELIRDKWKPAGETSFAPTEQDEMGPV